jgi:hypothetical protein
VKRILKYLKGTQEHGLVINSKLNPNLTNPLKLTGFVDADWAGDLEDRKSTTGFVFFYGSTPVSWCSKKQHCVATSSAEAEYVAMSEIIKEGRWIKMLINELKDSLPECFIQQFTVMEDNQSCIALTKTQNNVSRAKHIDIRYHFTREAVQSGEVNIQFCPSESMIADTFTKPLEKSKFIKNRELLSVLPPQALRGCVRMRNDSEHTARHTKLFKIN